MVVSVSAPRYLAPGETSEVMVVYKNVGKASWSPSGSNYVSTYHWDPLKKVETPSVFSSSGWETNDRAVRVPSVVPPQGSVTMRFPVRAPKTAGSYKGDFILVAENLVRMAGSKFDLTIQVGTPAISSAPSPVPVSPSAPSAVQPPANGEWSASLVSKGGNEWQIEPEQKVFVTFQFKNSGSKTWKRDGASYVSVYATQGTKERSSSFRTPLWGTASQAARMVESEVRPGQVGTFKLELQAPLSPGLFYEQFTLAAEDTSWIAGSAVVLPIRVPSNAATIAAQPATVPATSVSPSEIAQQLGYTATLLLRSLQSISVLGNGSQQVTLGFKNTGQTTWKSRSIKLANASVANTTLASFRDSSWLDAGTASRATDPTKPGEIGFVTFKVKGPPKKGSYTATFQLYADDLPVEGALIDIPVTVTADGYIEPEPPKPAPSTPTPGPGSSFTLNPQPLGGSEASLPAEPMIRVGLYKTTDNTIVVRAKYAPVSVLLNGQAVCRLQVGEQAKVVYDVATKFYTLSGGPCSGQSMGVYLFHADDDSSAMEIADYSRPVSWLPGANDNTFRRQLELRYVPTKDSVWVINELPIEKYLWGIAETSNVSPQQYQRALLVAARTYATYHVNRNTKHGGWFHVDAHLDQVYRGYGAEIRSPNIVNAINSTRGQIVTYDGKLAITPYFSRSDGRTRAWGEVWYGGSNYPWLVSVPVPDDIGKTLWGHGVGMSATGALQMDAKHGKNYQEILAHFYRGTELRKAYK